MQCPRVSLGVPQFLIALQMPGFLCKHKSRSPLPATAAHPPLQRGHHWPWRLLTFLFRGGEPRALSTDPSLQLTNAGDDVVVFYNDKASLATLLEMMTAARDGVEENSPLMYHISLVDLLAACAEGKNVYTEIKCTSLLPLEDVVRVVTHEDCITEVRGGGQEDTGALH